MKNICFSVLLGTVFILAGCAGMNKPKETQLQTRQYQIREFASQDQEMIFKAVLNTLLDDSFIIKSSDLQTGTIYAERDFMERDKNAVFVKAASTICFGPVGLLFGGSTRQQRNVEANAFISEFGKSTRVRLNFQVKVYSRGELKESHPFEENYYQQFFSKVDKGVFLEREGV